MDLVAIAIMVPVVIPVVIAIMMLLSPFPIPALFRSPPALVVAMLAMSFGFPSGVVDGFRRPVGAIYIGSSMLGAPGEQRDEQRRSEEKRGQSLHVGVLSIRNNTVQRCRAKMTSCSSRVGNVPTWLFGATAFVSRRLVEAAGVEPASEIAVSRENPCSVQFRMFSPQTLRTDKMRLKLVR
jgi:hypothetical protein